MFSEINCCIFEDSGNPHQPKSEMSHLAPLNRVFLDQLRRVAFEDGMSLNFSSFSHQLVRDNDSEAVSAVNAPRFDADYAINMYPSLSDIGPELGHLILNKRERYAHIFVITHARIMEANLLRGLSAVTQNAGKSKSEVITTFLESYDAEDAHILSFWNVEATRDEWTRRRLLSVFSST
ncbi:hypothetical protein KKF55_05230 [Patescibacteria group bacterium]|nr:hypothetical protein [Patescibacteria group bacterium]